MKEVIKIVVIHLWWFLIPLLYYLLYLKTKKGINLYIDYEVIE